MYRKLVSTTLLLLALGTVPPFGFAAGPASAAETATRISGSSLPRTMKLAVSKSAIVDFDEEIRDILVSNPSVADAVVRTNRRLFLLGNSFGTTNIVVFGANGRQIAAFDLTVQPDTGTLESLLRRLLPNSEISVEAIAGTVILRGSVRSPTESMQAYEVAARFVGAPITTGEASGSGESGSAAGSGGAPQVVNALTIRAKDQVMLKVTIVEMQRTAVKQLGINLSGAIAAGNFAASLATSNAFPISSTVNGGLGPNGLDPSLGWRSGADFLSGTLRALEQNGMMRVLAEPTLTAVSGEEASFLVGGEFPIPVSQDGGSITVSFKKFGISLGFVPVVLSEGRISLKVNTEVSEPTEERAVTTSSGGASMTVSGLRVRRADSTLEVPSGGTIVLAGLIRDEVRQAFSGTPGMMRLPILGTLFRSRDFLRSQSELAIFVQPVVVQPVAPNKLVRPDQNFDVTGDAAASFLGRVNKIYRSGGGASPAGAFHGQFGFSYE